jgi:hypothetical protein
MYGANLTSAISVLNDQISRLDAIVRIIQLAKPVLENKPVVTKPADGMIHFNPVDSVKINAFDGQNIQRYKVAMAVLGAGRDQGFTFAEMKDKIIKAWVNDPDCTGYKFLEEILKICTF